MDFLTFSKKAAAYAAEQNISDYELYYQADNTSQVSVLGETVDRLASSSVEGVSLRVIVNGRTGVSSTEAFTGEEIPELFKRALEAAEVAEEGVQQDIYAGGSYRELPAAAMPENDAAAEQAALLKAEGYACAADPRVQKGLMAAMADISSKTAISNSRGLYLESSGAMTVASMNVVAADESGKKYNDHASSAKACGADQDIKALAERAVDLIRFHHRLHRLQVRENGIGVGHKDEERFIRPRVPAADDVFRFIDVNVLPSGLLEPVQAEGRPGILLMGGRRDAAEGQDQLFQFLLRRFGIPEHLFGKLYHIKTSH